MNRLNPKALLVLLVLAVPLVVISAGVVSVLLFRAGYGTLIWAVAPFLVSLLIATVLALVLGRAASKPAGRKPPGGNDV